MGLSFSLAFLGSKASSLRSITDLLCSLMFRAVCTDVLFITFLNATTEDSAVAVGANGCHDLDGAFEFAKYSCFSILLHLEGFVASVSQCHIFTRFFRLRLSRRPVVIGSLICFQHISPTKLRTDVVLLRVEESPLIVDIEFCVAIVACIFFFHGDTLSGNYSVRSSGRRNAS